MTIKHRITSLIIVFSIMLLTITNLSAWMDSNSYVKNLNNWDHINATCTTSQSSTNVPITISSTQTGTYTSTLSISESGQLQDINLTNLNISHTWVGDLNVTLTSPGGTSVVVFNELCSSDNNLIHTFDDEASSGISCPPNTGTSVIPANALSAFDGEDINGTWTLTVSDSYGEDGGTINSWGVSIDYECNPEICDNGIDDDGDGLIDCNDPDCANNTTLTPSMTIAGINYPNTSSAFVCLGQYVRLSVQSGLSSGLTHTYPNSSVDNTPSGDSYFDISSINATHAGTHTLTYTNAEGCEVSQDFVLTITNPSITNVSYTNPDNCPDLNNGTITITATGNNLQYSINNGATYQSSNTFTGLTDTPSTPYNIRVRSTDGACYTNYTSNPVSLSDPICTEICGNGVDDDGNGDTDCDDSACAAVAIIPSITVNGTVYNSTSQTVCVGDAVSLNTQTGLQSGLVLTYPSGSTSNTPNGDSYFSTNSITPSLSGTFTITYTNANGCSSSQQYTVTVDEPEITNVALSNPSNCPSLNNGTITITATGNNLEYSIDNGATYQSSNVFTGLTDTPSSPYNVVIRNSSSGCTDAYASNPVSLTDPNCTEICNNNIDDDGDGDTDCDDSDCAPTLTSITFLHPLCENSGDGSITVGATGSNLEYSLDGTNWQAINTFTDLEDGAYQVRVRNSASGCTTTQTGSTTLFGRPCVEIPGNNIDDDGDGDVDCDDSDLTPIVNINVDDPLICTGESTLIETEVCHQIPDIVAQRNMANEGWNNQLHVGGPALTGDGEMCFTIADLSGFTMQVLGLNDTPLADADLSGIDYGFRVMINPISNQYEIYAIENGSNRSTIYASGTSFVDSVLCIKKEGSTITYHLNGNLAYTSNTGSNTDLYFDNSLFNSSSNQFWANGYIYFNDISLCGETDMTYAWSSSQTTADITVSGVGNYTVTVTDNYGCTASATTSISMDTCVEICDDNTDNDGDGDVDCDDSDCGKPSITSVTTSDPSNCYELNNGSIVILATGSNLEYSINNGGSYQSSNTFNNLTYGNYNVRVINTATGCYQDYSSVVSLIQIVCPEICDDGIDNDQDGQIDCADSQCGTPVISNVTAANADNCYDLNNGTISIAASGINREYSIDGGNTYQTAGNFTGLTPGNYNIIVRNSVSGCDAEYTSNPVVISAESCPEICNDGIDNDLDGQIDCADGDCGTPSISFVNYVTATNCPQQNNGSINIAATGSNLEYSINGTTYQSSSEFLNLTPGDYTIRVRNSVTGCTVDYANNDITLTAPDCSEICNNNYDDDGNGLTDCDDPACLAPSIQSVANTVPDNCPALDDGTITITATGVNLEYSINGTDFQATGVFNNLSNGTYTITVRNSVTGCTDTDASIIFNEGPCVEICNNNWDDDGNGLTDCDDPVCNAPEITGVSSTNPNNCYDLNNGTISITATGVNLEYSIDGSTYQASGNFTNLNLGNYNVTVRNSVTGCVVPYDNNPIALINITCPEICNDGIDNDQDGQIDCLDGDCLPNLTNINVQNANNCPNLNNGFIHIQVSSVSGLEFSIDGGLFYSTNQNFNGLSAGTYYVRVRNATSLCFVDYENNPIVIVAEDCPEICGNGIDDDQDGNIDCADSDCTSASFTGLTSTNPSNCPALDNGSITINATVTVGDIEFSIDNGNTWQSSNEFTNLENGNYQVWIRSTDSGCVTEYGANPVIIVDDDCTEDCGDGVDNDGDGDIDCDDSDCGQPNITDFNGQAPDNCPDLNNGWVEIVATGPNKEYSIDSINWQSSSVFTGISADTFALYVRNSVTGCVDVYGSLVTVIPADCQEICNNGIDDDGDGLTDCEDGDCPTPIPLTNSYVSPSNCPNLNNGSITVLALGPNRMFSIDGGATYQLSNQFTGLTPGTYNVRVRNFETGCYVDFPAPVILASIACPEVCGDGIDNDGDGNTDCADPDCGAPTINSVNATQATNCPTLNNGSISINASGTNLRFTINGGTTWQTSSTFTNLEPGTYNVAVRNNTTGCVTQYPFNPLEVTSILCPEVCNDGIDNDGDGDIDCQDFDCHGITISEVTSESPENCPFLNNGSISITATGDDLEYSVSNGIIYQDSPIFNNLTSGLYNIVVRNKNNGCAYPYPNNPITIVDPECLEICDNGVDDDGDGQIDCADGDCGTPTNIGQDHTDPDNCYALNNGNILMSGAGQDIEWSIDNGNTWHADPSFNGLTAGTYYLRARNSITLCEASGPTVTLYNNPCNEICNNGIDDDGDGYIDCADSECGTPTVGLVTAFDPYNCPTLNNGSIIITGSGNDLQYSINGGATWQSQSNFNNLVPGNYNIVLRNTSTGCQVSYPNNPVVLVNPVCGEICDDGIDNDGDGDIDCDDSECVNASNTYKIDFDIDTPVITKLNNMVAIAEGNVLYASDNSDAGFNYIITMVLQGGPGGGSAVPFPSTATLKDSEFHTDDPSIVLNGNINAIDLDIYGREYENGGYVYYRDNTTRMVVNMYLDNGQAFSNIQYTLVDIDMDMSGSNYDFTGSYIDQVQIVSGAGTNIITPYNSSYLKVVGDFIRPNFTDANNNNIPDQHEFNQIQAFQQDANVTIRTPGTVGRLTFIYNDYNQSIEGDPDGFHDYDSGNQRIGIGRYTTFESGCQTIEICDDGIDNDGDGDVDCNDDDCNPIITFIGATDTDNCPLLNNGSIQVTAIGTNLEYRVIAVSSGNNYNSGWVSNPNFTGLSDGSYNVEVRNTQTGCSTTYAGNPLVIEDPECPEICGDGIDNDGDGAIDCEDPDCELSTITNIDTSDPTNCPDNDNGSITVYATGNNLEYSIDGGATWQTSNTFTSLVPRNYSIIVRNTVTGCLEGFPNNPISLTTGNCPCVGVNYAFRANFENTTNDNQWTFNYGASDGNWEIGPPSTYSYSGTPLEIVPYRGSQDLLTGNGYEQDLDGGPSTATSRTFTLSSAVTSIDLSLQYYFGHLDNSSSADYLQIQLRDASDNSLLETIVSETGAASLRSSVWTSATADLTSHAGKSVYLRVIAADAGSGSKLEAAVDDIIISEEPEVTLVLPYDNFCLDQGSFILSGGSPSGGTYSGPGIIDGATFNASLLGTGEYTITYSYTANDGCEVTSTDVVDVLEAGISVAAQPYEICIGEDVEITANGNSTGPYSFEWSNGLGSGQTHTVSPAASTQYQVTVTDANGCTASTLVSVLVNPSPQANLQVADEPCFSDDSELIATGSGGTTPYTFLITGPSGFSTTSHNPQVAEAGTYTVVVTDANGCTDSESVVVLDSFEPTLDLSDSDICYGQSTTLTVNPAGLTYLWGPTASNASSQAITVSPTSTTDYSVTVTDANGCQGILQATVTVLPEPNITLTSTDFEPCDEEEITLTTTVDNPQSGATYTYNWSNGDTGANINVTPSTNTTYTVTVTDNLGCSASESVDIEVFDAEFNSVALGDNVDCEGNCTGSITFNVDYAVTGPFNLQYTFNGVTYTDGPHDFGSNPPEAITITDLCAGTYSNLTVISNASGCTETWPDDIVISESHADWEHVTHTSNVSNCAGVCDGSFTIDANLGVTGEFNVTYTYEGSVVSLGPYNHAGDILIDNLCPGEYSDITITSVASGCQDIWPTSIIIEEPEPDANLIAEIDDSCQQSEGSVTINVSGGSYPYIVNWSSLDGTHSGSDTISFHGNITIENLIGGNTYCFDILDNNGCSADNSGEQ